MRKRRIFAVIALILSFALLIVGCKQNTASTGPEKTGETSGTGDTASTEPASNKLEPYTFTHYFNYDWWDIKPWGQDEVSKVLKEKFNVTVEFSKPDSDPDAKLNVMISSGDLPDSIMMDRGPNNIKLAQLGLLQPLEPLMAKNPNLEKNLLPSTIEMLKIDGKLYGIPNWPRTKPTGGNNVWIYDKKLWEAAGSPKLETFEDLYNFAKKIKTDVPKTAAGLPTIPFSVDYTPDGNMIAGAFYRSFGGVLTNGWYTVLNGKYQLVFRDPVFKQASLEINRWWREGLISETQFTDTTDQILEKIVAGRTALLYYDHSKDDTNKFRKLLMQNCPGDSYEIVQPNPYPPANGLSPSDIYADYKETIGWNVTCITKNAKDPQRIFDLWTYLLTPEAALLQMYGPQGEMWDKLDDQGRPILKKPESEFTPDEVNRLGLWFWMIPGHSDHVDELKFAVNAMQPPDKQSWVISTQANILTPIMWMSDEFVGIPDTIDPQSDEGVKRTLCENYIKEQYPRMIMASSQSEAEAIYQGIIDFCDKNGMPAIEEIYDKKYKDNVAKVGTGLTKGIYAK